MKRMVTIAGTEETVTKPIINSISKDIVTILKLNPNDTTVKYNNIPLLLEYSNGSSTVDKSLRSNILDISFKEEPVQELELTRIPIHPDTNPFYYDKETNTKAITAYRSMKLNFNIVFKSKSRSTLNRILDLLHIKKIDGDIHNHHNIQISFQMPNIIKQFISEILEIKNTYAPLTMEEFVDKTFNKSLLDNYLSLDGNIQKSTLAIKEYQTEVLGYFVGEFLETEKDKDGVYFNLNLNYILQYQKPIAVHMEFPYIIYNNRLSDVFIKPTENYVLKYFRNHEKELIQLLENHSDFGINKQGYYLTYPRDDDFSIRDKMYGYTPIMSILCIIDKDNPRELFNIRDEGLSIKFLDTVYNFMITQKDTITKYKQSFFYFALYENNDLKANYLTFDELGNIIATIDLDLRNIYRVLLFICDDVTIIPNPYRQQAIDFINAEIESKKNIKRELVDFQFDKYRESFREKTGIGVEQYKNEPLFLDVYLSFFNVKESDIFKIITTLPIKNPGDVLLKVKMPDYNWPKLTCWHHTRVYNLFKD